MSDSALALTSKLAEGLTYSDLILHEGAVANLYESQINELKKNCALTNIAYYTSGTGVRASAMVLYNIKKNTPPKNWAALIENGDLHFSKSVAIDLVKGWEFWLADSNIPDTLLANLSARSIGKIGRAIEKDPNVRAKIKKAISDAGRNGLSEREVSKVLGKGGVKVNKSAAGKKAKKGLDPSASKEEVVDYYTKIVDGLQASLDRGAQQFKKVVLANQDKAGEIAKLKEQIRDLKAAQD